MPEGHTVRLQIEREGDREREGEKEGESEEEWTWNSAFIRVQGWVF